jgi:hypothetical protein
MIPGYEHRWQVEAQWQWLASRKGNVASKGTPPQRQPPVSGPPETGSRFMKRQ